MKFIKTIVITAALLLFLTPFAQAAALKDIQEGQSFYKEISYLLNEGIISGYIDGTFKPGEKVTRAAAAAMIGRSLGFEGVQRESSFNDVAKESFASGYIEEAVEKNIIKGYTDGTFRPNDIVTRGQMAIFISRAFQLKETKDIQFFDVSKSMAAYPSIGKILSAGITNGYSDWTFRPNKELTRAEFSAFLARGLNEEFKVTLPVIEPINVDYKISGGEIEANHHNGKLFVLKPSQQIHLNKLNNETDRVLIDSSVLKFEDQNTISAVKPGVGYITIIPRGYSWEKAYTYEVLVGEREDVTKSVINSHFIELANDGYLNGCEFSVDQVRTENVTQYFSTTPKWSGYYEGGYGRSYNGCIYFGSDSSPESPIGAIVMEGSKINKIPGQIKQVIGKPDYEGYSEMDGLWTMYYRLKNGYELFFSFKDPSSKLMNVLYKDKSLD
ncbi:S-layer homology domain-containing protein [Rossellomorea oryzaecorticis]|uniref:S-layer homology domain-containing protein n=1 Tax=Rossellomorea oryzaecorticis TaxID=1396505 RepID=A0ABW8VWR6_9BACI